MHESDNEKWTEDELDSGFSSLCLSFNIEEIFFWANKAMFLEWTIWHEKQKVDRNGLTETDYMKELESVGSFKSLKVEFH